MTKQKTTEQLENELEEERIRIILNPHTKLWHVYRFDSKACYCCVDKLALRYASKYGELKPSFAPDGAPSFVGNVTRHKLSTKHAKELRVHPYAPSVTYLTTDEMNAEPFAYSNHLLVDRDRMYVSDNLNESGT